MYTIRFESLLLGNHDNIVEHDGKVYLLESNEKLLKFMQWVAFIISKIRTQI